MPYQYKYRRVVNATMSLYALSVFTATAYALNQYSSKPAYPPIYSKGVINPNIAALAKIKNPDATLPPRTSLDAWNKYLQQGFLRPAGIDHQEMAQMEQDPKHAQMMPYFEALNMNKPIYPAHRAYAGVFIFGGTPCHTNERFKFLAEVINTKRIDATKDEPITVTYINGNRKIAESEVQEAKELGVECTHQHECAQKIWDAHYSGLPVNFKMLTIDPPSGRRANTDDTLKGFYTQFPRDRAKRTSLLGISNQPYVPYQGDTADAVSIREGRTDLDVEVIGNESPTAVPDITCLDSIARRVYTQWSLKNKP